MRSWWRGSAPLVLVLTVVILLSLASIESTAVADLVIISPTGSAPAYCRPGNTIEITASVVASEGEQVYMRAAVGDDGFGEFENVGTCSSTSEAFTVEYRIAADEADGWKGLTVQAYSGTDPTLTETEPSAICVDTVAPSKPSSFHLSPYTPANDTTPTWTWACNDNAGGAGLNYYKVDIRKGGQTFWTPASPSTVTGASWTPSPALTEDATYRIRVRAVDHAGNESAWGESNVYSLDTKAPAPPTTVTTPGFTNDTTPTFTWSGAWDNNSGMFYYIVYIYDTGSSPQVVKGPFNPQAHGSSYSWDLPSGNAFQGDGTDDGTYQIRVYSVDYAYNQSEGYGSGTFVLDTQGPVLSNGIPSGDLGSMLPTAIGATFTYAGAGLDESKVEFTVTYGSTSAEITEGFTIGNPQPVDGNDNAFSVDITYATNRLPSSMYDTALGRLRDGTYTVDMVACDLAGNESTLNWSFCFDTTPPTDPGPPVAGSPNDLDDKWYFNTQTPTFTWAASTDPGAPDGTPGSGLARYWFQFGLLSEEPDSSQNEWESAVRDRYILPNGTSTEQWTPVLPLQLVPGEEYAARVKAFDELGNESDWVDPPLIFDPDPPTGVTDLAGDSDPGNTRPVFTWGAATDGISGVDGYRVRIGRRTDEIDEGDPYFEVTWDILDMVVDFPDGRTGQITWQIGFELGIGRYVISVAARDVAGNEGSVSELGFAVEDVTGPEAPVLTLKTPSPTNSPQEWEWTWPADAVSFQFGGSVDPVAIPTSYLVEGAIDSTTTDLAEGIHYLRVRALDELGNAGAWSMPVSVVVDNHPPDEPTGLAVVNRTKDTRPEWVWNVSGDASVAGYEVSLDCGWTVFNIGRVTTFRPATALADGSHTLSVRAFDAAGNVSEWVTATVEIDTEPPTVVFVNPSEHGEQLNISTSSTIIVRVEEANFSPSWIKMSVSGSGWMSSTATVEVESSSTFYFILDRPLVADDIHTATVWVHDDLGNEAYETVSFSVENYRPGIGFGRFRFDEAPDKD
jgi:hypothetical protein